jgi:pectinesterase
MKNSGLCFAAAILSLTASISGASAQASYRVAHDCAGAARCFTAIQAALDAAGGDGWVTVKVDAGDFYEKVTIRRPKTVLKGEGVGRTRLHFDAVAQTAGQYHRDHWGTPGSATLTIDADQVTVDGLTIENTYDFLANDALAAGDPRKTGNSQAAAVLLDVHSDRVLIENASLLGYQDTLFANGGRAYIRRSLIAGNIDFIFGNGRLLIAGSEIRTRNRASAVAPGDFHSFVVAPSTQLSQAIGIVVYRSRLTREAGVPDNSVALGRPWHPTTRFADGRYADPNAVGQASFIDCFMDAHIHPDHWTTMGGTARDGSKSAVFRPQDSRFSEAGSYGPGARHNDIGIAWSNPLGMRDVTAAMFAGWPEARRLAP